jgi:hypothetical protein
MEGKGKAQQEQISEIDKQGNPENEGSYRDKLQKCCDGSSTSIVVASRRQQKRAVSG